jgi:uncharacterized protein
MTSLIEEHRMELQEACRAFGVRRLELFGSGSTGAFDFENSDLDFIVTFADRGAGYADRYLGLAERLERIFNRHVDLLTERSIQNPILKDTVQKDRVPVYEQGDNKAVA